MEKETAVTTPPADNTVPEEQKPVLDPEPETENTGAEKAGGMTAGAEPEKSEVGKPEATPEGKDEGEPEKKDETILNPEEPEAKPEDAQENEFLGAPENYETFTLPEGFALNDEQSAQVTELFKEMNLSQKGGQKLVDAYTRQVIAQKEAQLNGLAERRKAWREEIRNRPNFAAERALAMKGMRAVVQEPEEIALFKDSWMSDHPALFSVFLKVGRLLGEDSPLSGGGNKEPENINLLRFPVR